MAKDKTKKTTSKKQKLVGVRYYIDSKTGEAVPFIETSVEDRDFNFHKMWLNNLIMALDEITNKKMELAFWIIEHLDKENKLVMTQRVIAEKSGISFGTVCETMKLLQQGDMPFLQKINSGAYRVNPDVLYKGSHSNRMGIVFDYSETAIANSKNNAPIDREAVQMELDEVIFRLENEALSTNEKTALETRKDELQRQLSA